MAEQHVSIVIDALERAKGAIQNTVKDLEALKAAGAKASAGLAVADRSMRQTEAATRKLSTEQVKAAGTMQRLGNFAAEHQRQFAAVQLALAGVTAGYAALVGQATKSGIEFNASLESSQLGLAAVFKQFDQVGKFKTFGDAMTAAQEAITILQTKALTSTASFQELVQAFQAISGAASAANIPIRKQIDLVVLMSQTLAGLGIRNEQIMQESRALISGNITEDALAAKILGIKRADVEKAREAGQLYEFLASKMKSFSEAGELAGRTYRGAVSNFGDASQQAFGSLTKQAFETMKQGFLDLQAIISKPEFKQSLEGTAKGVNVIVSAIMELTKLAAANIGKVAAAFAALTAAVGVTAAAVVGLKGLSIAGGLSASILGVGAVKSLADYVAALQLMGTAAASSSLALGAIGVSVASLTAVVWAGVEAWRAYQASKALAESTDRLKNLNARWSTALGEDLANRRRTGELGRADADALIERLDRANKLVQERKLNEEGYYRLLKGISSELVKQQTERTPEMLPVPRRKPKSDEVIRAEAEADLAIYRSSNEIAEAQLDSSLQRRVISIQKYAEDKRHLIYQEQFRENQFLTLQSQTSTAQERVRLTAQIQINNDKAKAALAALAAEEVALRAKERGDQLDARRSAAEVAYQTQLMATQKLVQSGQLSQRDGFEKDKVAASALAESLKAINAELALLSSQNPTMPEFKSKLSQGQVEERQVSITAAAPSVNDWSVQMKLTMQQMRDEFELTAQKVAQSFHGIVRGSIDTVADGLTDVFYKTKTWNQALMDIERTIGRSIVNSIIKMFTEWVTQRAIAGLASIAWSTKEGAVDVAAKAPGALMTSISSYGIAAAVGAAALIAAMGALQGFNTGGQVAGGTPGRDSVLAMLTPGEMVIRAPVVSQLGAAHFDAYNRGEIPEVGRTVRSVPSPNRSGMFNAGGLVANAGAAIQVNPAKISVGILRTQSDVQDFMESESGQKLILKAVKGGRYDIGIS